MTIRYPYSRPVLESEDIAAIRRVLESQFLTQGPDSAAFESELAAAFGCREAVVVNSGTAALHLAYIAAGLGPERGLLTSAMTFLATANAARMLDAPVVFEDVDPRTGNLDPESVKKALASAPFPIGAIATVHLAGRVSAMAELRKIADAHGCMLIEDACHAPGTTYDGGDGQRHKIGSCAHSDFAVFSFHAVKHIAMGEGGAVCTNDSVVAERMRKLRSHGMSRKDFETPPEVNAPWYYEMNEIGWNYRASDIQCALGRTQLHRLDSLVAERRRIAKRYDRLLGQMPHLRVPEPAHPEEHAYHLYAVDIDFKAVGKTRGEVMTALAKLGVGTQVHYIPLYHQPYYRRAGHKPLPGTEAYYAGTLSIPLYLGLTDGDLEIIAGALRDVLA